MEKENANGVCLPWMPLAYSLRAFVHGILCAARNARNALGITRYALSGSQFRVARGQRYLARTRLAGYFTSTMVLYEILYYSQLY